MPTFSIKVANDPNGNDAYLQDLWVRSAVTSTSLTFDSGDYKLVFTGHGIGAGVGTITGATLYQVDLSSGAAVLVPIAQSRSTLALTVQGLDAAIKASQFEFGAFGYLFRGNDSLTGSAGDDFVRGYGGNDTLNGLGGNDRLDGGSGSDRLSGGDGNDTLDGGTGADVMSGGAGNDGYFVDSANDRVVEVAAGGLYDRVELAYTASNFVLADNVELLDIDHLDYTTPAVLTASGNALANKISVISATPNAAEAIFGLGGNDRIFTAGGNDTLDGGSGTDTLMGGDGNDVYIVTALDDRLIESSGTGSGTDTVRASITYTLGANFENLTLTGSAAINGSGNSAANVLVGNAGANRLVGGAGNDSLSGGLGNDTLIGGTGSDRYVANSAGDVLTETSTSTTSIDSVTASIDWTLGANFENLTLTGSGAIDGSGNGKANALVGNGKANVLTGGAGADTLTGGAGADRFRFVTPNDGKDIITDFTHGSDKLYVVAANFGLDAGDAAVVVVNGAPLAAVGTFLYTSSSGVLAFDADGTGAGAAVAIARLAPLSLVPSDFVLGP